MTRVHDVWRGAHPGAPRPPDAPRNALPPWQPDTAVVVFDRERAHNRREAALHRPLPAGLPALARSLRALGVPRLVVVLPHAPGLLPQALRAGLASLDEQAVSALGFEQLVLVRPAHLAGGAAAGQPGGALHGLARAVLSQLRWMVPQREQALRPAKVAQFVAELALALPAMAAGTRVVPPELVWDWAQPGAAQAVLQAWLQGRPGPLVPQPVPRLQDRPRRRWCVDNRPMNAPLANDSFLRACLRQPTDHTPLWLMRQAGRYLPEYRASRLAAGNSFMGLATSPHYATEVTLQPLDRYQLDAAILFSDILTVPDAMGLGLSFGAGEGPRFAHPVRDEAAVARLAVPDLDKLRYVFDAVTSIRKALITSDGQGRRVGRVPLIGFSGSPWTLACYMVEGGGSDDYRLVKTMLYARPDLLHRILAVNADAVAAYLNAQIDAGAQAVMVFDSWGGVLEHRAFHQFSLAYTQRVMNQLKREHEGQRVPAIVFTKGGGQWLEQIAATGADVVGLDWTCDLGQARRRVDDQVALQGNLDPMVLFATPEAVAAEARAVLDSFGAPQRADGRWGGHVFNLGHGINQHTPVEHVQALVEAVHSHSPTLRRPAASR